MSSNCNFDQSHDCRLSQLMTELSYKNLKKQIRQKCWIFRKSEKKNLLILVHRAPSCITFKKTMCFFKHPVLNPKHKNKGYSNSCICIAIVGSNWVPPPSILNRNSSEKSNNCNITVVRNAGQNCFYLEPYFWHCWRKRSLCRRIQSLAIGPE